MQTSEMKSVATRVSIYTIIVNFLLSILKAVAGIFGHSSAMISDAVHSASDVFSTIIVMIGVHISAKQEDSSHQYGHERFESIAAILLAVILTLTGFGIGYAGLSKILGGDASDITVPGILPLVMAVVSIIVKEGMYWYTIAAAKKVQSDALRADAWHHRSDAFSSIGSLIGIAGARMGFPVLDPIASVIICILIIKAAYDIAKDAIVKLVDSSCDQSVEQKICEVVMQQDGVKRVDLLKTRLFGSRFYVDIEISVDGYLPLYQAHGIAERVHDAIEANFPGAKHCMVHVNPYDET